MTPLLRNSNPLEYDLARQLQACQSNSRRNGKVARLPFVLRAEVNRMIEDGVPYKIIIERLGEAGKHLTEQNLSTWRLGGYQDYVKAQAISDRARSQTEAAADVVRESGHVDPVRLQRVCQEIALLQYMQTLMHHGERIAQDSLKKNPAKMITLINACCNSSNAARALEKRKSAGLGAPASDGPMLPSNSAIENQNSKFKNPEPTQSHLIKP